MAKRNFLIKKEGVITHEQWQKNHLSEGTDKEVQNAQSEKALGR